jgi:hypothetical protein
MDVDFQPQLQEMPEGSEASPSELDTHDLLPVLLPASFFADGKWPGPYTRLRTGEIGLTWAVRLSAGSVRYVSRAMQSHWEARGMDWQALALSNLSRYTKSQPGPRTLRRIDGEVFAIAFLDEDGLGPSRLLFREMLSELFPLGYRVAIPERSCALAFSNDVTEQELKQVEGVTDHCYRHGTRPFVPSFYAADDLLPA